MPSITPEEVLQLIERLEEISVNSSMAHVLLILTRMIQKQRHHNMLTLVSLKWLRMTALLQSWQTNTLASSQQL